MKKKKKQLKLFKTRQRKDRRGKQSAVKLGKSYKWKQNCQSVWHYVSVNAANVAQVTPKTDTGS